LGDRKRIQPVKNVATSIPTVPPLEAFGEPSLTLAVEEKIKKLVRILRLFQILFGPLLRPTTTS